jgi:Domain of unknown function (DUF4384)
MILKAILFTLLLALGGIGGAQIRAQEVEEADVRGAFMTTRPKTPVQSASSNPKAKPNRRQPKRATPTPAPGTPVVKTDNGVSRMRASKLGLGLTLFMRDANGLAVRVNPTHVFHKGDRVRVLMETNTEGYLYIFNTTDGGKPVMLYPNSELDEGGNYIRSHVPIEIPSSEADEERLRWLSFDEYAGNERLFFVFTREPLPTVPLEDELLSFCKNPKNKCPAQPSAALWAKIQSELDSPPQIAMVQKFGKAETANEHVATTRGMGLSKEDPEPSLVMMTASANTRILVVTLDLVHK